MNLNDINRELRINWDPISLGESGPMDEYIEYAQKILIMIEKGDNEEGIFNYLKHIRIVQMMLQENDEMDKKIAKHIFSMS